MSFLKNKETKLGEYGMGSGLKDMGEGIKCLNYKHEGLKEIVKYF